MTDSAAVSKYINALLHGEPIERWEAAGKLGELGDRAAVEPLMIALLDQNDDVRKVAAVALGELEDPLAIPALERAQSNDLSWIGEAAQLACERIRFANRE